MVTATLVNEKGQEEEIVEITEGHGQADDDSWGPKWGAADSWL